jgi:hypothetical protein
MIDSKKTIKGLEKIYEMILCRKKVQKEGNLKDRNR